MTGLFGLDEPLPRYLAFAKAQAALPWSVVVARQGREMQVAAELTLAGWSTYVPVQTVWLGGGQRRRRVNVPLFSRYLFAACWRGAEADAHRDVRDLVSVKWADGRSRVSPGLLARLMIAEANHAFDDTWEAPRTERRAWACGQPVKVRAGVAKGMDAMIVKVLSERKVLARVPFLAIAGFDDIIFETGDLEAVEAPRAAA